MLLEGLMKKIFGDPNEKELKSVQVYVDAVNALEKDMALVPVNSLIVRNKSTK